MTASNNTTNFPDPFHQASATLAFQTHDLTTMKTLLDQINASAGNATKSISNGFS